MYKRQIKASTYYGRDGPYQIADQINESIAMGDWTAYVNLPKAIQSVTSDQIKEVATKYFVEDRSTTGWFVPKVVNTLTASRRTMPGPNYFRDPAIYGPLGNETADTSGKGPGKSESVVDFSSQMKREKIGPIDLITIDLPIEGVVSFVGSIAAGDSLSPADAPMLASLTASMLDKGTTNADRFQIAEQLDTLGADIGFSAGTQSLSFSGQFLRPDAGPVMELLSDQLRNPAFNPEVLETLKSRHKAGLLQAIDNPDYRAESQLSRLLYPETHVNYSTSIDVLIKDLERTSAKDLVAFHEEHYGAESMRLIFAGDIDFEQLKAAVENAFEGWSGGSPYPELETTQLENRKHSERIYIEDKTSVAVRLGYNTELQRTDDDYLPFMLGNYILGGSFHSRLMTEVRKNRGLTYDIRARHQGDIITPGNWLLSVSLAPSLLDEGLTATYEVVDDWYTNGVSKEEVAAAIETLNGGYLVGLSTTGAVAGQLHSFVERGFDPEYIDAYPSLLLKIKAEDVNRSIKKYFHPDQLIEVAAGSLTKPEIQKKAEANTTPITVRLDTPDPSWSIQIEKVYRTKESIVVISQLSRSADMAAQVISTVSDSVEVDTAQAELPIKHYIIGKTWDWGDTGEYSLIDGMDAFGGALENAELLFSREK